MWFFRCRLPPPPKKLKLRQILVLCDFSSADYPPPRKLKLRQILVLCDFSSADYPPPHRKLKLRQILALCDFSGADYPPPENWNLGRSWYFVIFQVQITPPTPPTENWNLGRSWYFVIFQVQITPPPRKLKLRQILALCDFSSADYPPPRKLKLRQILVLCDFSSADYPPQKLKLRQILALCDFSSADYPPPPPPTPPTENWNLGRSWHFVIFQVQITPPPRKLKLRQILALCDFSSADYPPPPFENMKLWQIFPMGKYVWQVTTYGDFIQPG